MEYVGLIALIVLVLILLIVFFSFVPVGLWVSARASGVKVRISALIGMRIRRIVPARLVNPLIKATKAGLDVTLNKMEAHYLAGRQRGPRHQRPDCRAARGYLAGV